MLPLGGTARSAKGAPVSLRLKINLLIALLMAAFVGVLVLLQVDDTRRSVHEEVQTASVVATQLLGRISRIYGGDGLPGLADFLVRLGRVRANDITLYDETGRLMYRTSPPTYKFGRDAPPWFSRLVVPKIERKEIILEGGGKLVIEADASRAALDGWDDLVLVLEAGGVLFVLCNFLVFWLVSRAVSPLEKIVDGLGRLEGGDYQTRLPPLPGYEAGRMSAAFNRMAQAVEESLAAKREAAEAEARLAANRELTQQLQARVEEERRAIARELHDELGQSITAIKSIGLAIAQRASGADETIERSARMVVETAGLMYDATHRMISRLRPLALDYLGLADAVEDMVAGWRLQHSNTQFGLHCDALPDTLGDDVKTTAYRIVQESVTNALRHSGAGRIDIELRLGEGALAIRVGDDGRGLVADADGHGHYGLRGMRERATALGGSVEISKSAGGGIQVSARLPLEAVVAT